MLVIKSRDNKELNTTEYFGNLPDIIHYGNSFFDTNKFEAIKNYMVKPRGGFWTSPIDSNLSWYQYCLKTNYKIESLNNWCILKFKENAKILLIDNINDLLRLPINKKRFITSLDFELIAEFYDAIWLTEDGQYRTRLPNNEIALKYNLNLYSWDVETILILNKDAVYQVSNNDNSF